MPVRPQIKVFRRFPADLFCHFFGKHPARVEKNLQHTPILLRLMCDLRI